MVEDLDARIGRRLREVRLRAGLDIDGVSRRSGLQPATIGLYEAGRTRIPVGVLTRLAELLGASVTDFFA